MVRYFLYAVFIAIYLLIAFFGLGPVIFADGSSSERIITLLIVIAVFIIITLIFRWLLRKTREIQR